jgi:2-(1,2-epoxy-1,2-dihydrophenyl)acetyl-CoA isomerase
MTYQTILFDHAEGVARITLNRPGNLNALCDAMFPEIHDALDRIEAAGDVRVLVVTGAGRGFCAGADLNFPVETAQAAGSDLGATLEKNYNPLILRIRGLTYPVIASVNGVAAGAGASLALAADIVIAAQSAQFILAFARIGLVPDAGATYFFTQILGTARAMGLALLGEKVSASDAQSWGLIWKCVADDELAQATDALARHFASAPTRAMALTKRAIYAAERGLLANQLGLERQLQRELGATHDFKEGVAAFKAKRKANFVGR